MRRIAIFLACVTAASHAAAFSDPFITPEMDKYLVKGVDGIYNMQWDQAEADALKAIELNPEHPNGYMGLAGILWTKYVYGTDQTDQTLLKPFDEAIKKTERVAEAWLKKHPKDPMGLMTLGSAYGIDSRLMVIRHQWLGAYWVGRKAVNITREAVKQNPELWDGYLGLGMYDYYTDVYPRFIGVLAKVVLRGNRLRGIETLNLVAEKGHYSQNNAKILLVEISLEDKWGARDTKRAVELVRELRAKYPMSAMMHSSELVALEEDGRHEDVVKGAQEYLARVKKGTYAPIEEAKGEVCLATALWQLKRYDEARAAFRAAEGVPYMGRMSRWAVWAHVRHGNMEDMLGKRADAVRLYQIAAAQPDTWDFKRLAKAGLSKPFAGPVGPIDPTD